MRYPHGALTALSAAALLAVALPVGAHHSFPSTYFVDKTITIKGKVTEFMFRNPHSVVQVLAPGDDGKMYRWAVEWAALAHCRHRTSSRRSLA